MSMPKIDAYSFGQMTINSQAYASDLIIFPSGLIQDNWRRGEGHLLTKKDIAPLIRENPGLIIVGTGAYNRMLPDQALPTALGDLKIDLIMLPTDQAVTEYNNKRKDSGLLGACFHLTC